MFERDRMDIARSVEIVIGPMVRPRGKVEKRPPSTNDSNRQTQGQRWRVRQEWRAHAKKAAEQEREAWSKRHGLKWRTFARCTVTVVFVIPTRGRRDWDNLVSTMKPFFDGIVDALVIADDSTACIERISFDWIYEKGVSSTHVEIAEIAE